MAPLKPWASQTDKSGMTQNHPVRQLAPAALNAGLRAGSCRSFLRGQTAGLDRGRGKTRHTTVGDVRCLPGITVGTPVCCATIWMRGLPIQIAALHPLVDWRVRLERADQVLIAAISGATPMIAITRFML
jgi:hypothetical protein